MTEFGFPLEELPHGSFTVPRLKHVYHLQSRTIGVYLLVLNKEVVYVGLSVKNVIARSYAHLGTKDFNKVVFLALPETWKEESWLIEKSLMRWIRPLFNRREPTCRSPLNNESLLWCPLTHRHSIPWPSDAQIVAWVRGRLGKDGRYVPIDPVPWNKEWYGA